MKNQNHIKTLLVTITALSLGAVASQAAVTTWTGASNSDFGTPANWSNNSPGEDGADFVATIGNGDTVNLSSPYASTDPFRLTVNGNSTLNVSSSVTARYLNIGAGSTVNILSGADFLMPQVSAGNNGTYTFDGTLEIRGGSAVFNERLFGSGTIRVIGSDATTINFHQIAGALNYEFEFDSTGVSGLVGAGASGAGPYWSALSSSTLTVDASAYHGNGTFTLFETTDNSFSIFNTANITVTGAGAEAAAGEGWRIQQYQSGGKNLIELTITQPAPEPSTLGLLLVGGTLLGSRRRKFARN